MSPAPGQQEKQSSGARDVYTDPAAEKVVEDEKKRVEKDPLVSLTDFTGDVPETHITNAMTRLPGFPARLVDGELVDIVRKEATATNTKVKQIGAYGHEYQEDVNGLLEDFKDEDAESKNVQPPYGMTQKAAEKATELRKKQTAAA